MDKGIASSVLVISILLLSGFQSLISFAPITDGNVEPSSDEWISSPSSTPPEPPAGPEMSAPNQFMKNMGQLADDDIILYSRGGHLRAGFCAGYIIFDVRNGSKGYSYTMEFAFSNDPLPEGRGELPHGTNFFIGGESDWITSVPSYDEVIYRDLYDDIDMVFRIDDDGLKYDMIVHPGGDPSDIAMIYDGVFPSLKNGALVIDTPAGSVIEDPPRSYQGDGSEVESSYVLEGNILSFRVGDHDGGTDLVIDPGVRFSTYLGASNLDEVNDIAVDAAGNTYVVGTTKSSSFPTTRGAYDVTANSGDDVFVTKLNASGDRLIYSTYLGGSGDDAGFGIDIDSSGNAYVVGRTSAASFPTANSFRTTFGGNTDGFITKIGSSGTSLVYSALIGGWSQDGAYDVVVDSSGRAIVTGYAGWFWSNWGNQWRFPTTSGAYDRTFNGNQNTYDVFLMRVSASGGSMDFSTLIGSSGNEYGYAVSYDENDNYFVTGETNSNNFPTTSGAFDRTRSGLDAFVSKFNQYGSSLLASTFLGGGGTERGWGLDVDTSGRPYVTGETNSNNFPTTADGYDRTPNGNYDAFVTVLNSDLSGLYNSTYVGGSSSDSGQDLFLGSDGAAYVTGSTQSSNFPVSSEALQSSSGGGTDAFVTVLNMTAGGLVYSTYFGGSGTDIGKGVRVDDDGLIFIGGHTGSQDLIVSLDAYDRTQNGNVDGFVTRFYPADFSPSSLTADPGYFHVNLSWSPPSSSIMEMFDIIGYRIYRAIGSGAFAPLTLTGNTTTYNDTINYFISRTYRYRVTAVFDSIGESKYSNMVSASPLVTPMPNDPTAIEGDLFVNITWQPIASVYMSIFNLSYHVYRGLSPSFLTDLGSVGLNDHYNDTDIAPHPRVYYYAVSYVLEGIGESNLTSPLSAKPNTPPSEPEPVNITPGNLEMDISWQEPSDDGGYPVNGYTIFRGLTKDTMSNWRWVDASTMNVTDTSIIPGRIYYYQVTAGNRLGSSGRSYTVSALGQTVPSAPTKLMTIGGDGEVQVMWDRPDEMWDLPLTGYRLEIERENLSSPISIYLPPDINTYHDTVENGDDNMYRLSALNIHGEGAQAGPVHGMGRGIPGPAISPFSVPGDGEVKLVWSGFSSDGGSPMESVKVYRGDDIYTPTLVAVLPPMTREYTQSGLRNGHTYFYWISGVNALGEGPVSAPVKAIPGRVPGPVTDLSVVPGLERVDLDWSMPLDNGGREVTGYRIYRGTSVYNMIPVASVQSSEMAYSDAYLEPHMTYLYSISALNSLGEGPLSPPAAVEVKGRASPPVIVNISSSAKSVSLNWTAPSDDGGSAVTGYRVEFREEGETEWGHIDVDGTGANIGGMTSGDTYIFRVMARTNISFGLPSEEVSVIIGILPEPPSALLVMPGSHVISLRWTPVPLSDRSMVSYRIYMAVNGSPFNLLAEVDRIEDSFMVDGLMTGVEYTFSISSVNLIGEGEMSSNRTVLLKGPPGAPSALWVSRQGSDRIVIEWLPPVDTGGSAITEYRIFRGSRLDSMAEMASSTTTTFEDTGVEGGRTYYYMVKARNSEGMGPGSEPVRAYTIHAPGKPTSLETEVHSDKVVIRWAPPADDGGSEILGYIVYRSDDGGSPHVLAELGPGYSEYTDRSVGSGGYTYSVAAVNTYGRGPGASGDVEVPSRLIRSAAALGISFLIPLVIFLFIAFLPGYLRKRRLRKEEMKAKEAAIREQQTSVSGLRPHSLDQLPLGRMPPRVPTLGTAQTHEAPRLPSFRLLPPHWKNGPSRAVT